MNPGASDAGGCEARMQEGEWTSLHIFIHDFARIDAFLREGLATLPAPVLRQSFFVRYWYGAPHVRLRFRGSQWRPMVESRLHEYLRAHPFVSTLDPGIYYVAYANHLATEVPSTQQPAWYENGSIHEIPYVREVDRYGGQQGVRLAEKYFVWDSGAMLNLIGTERASTIEKIMLGYCLAHRAVLRELKLDLDHDATISALLPDVVERNVIADKAREKISAQVPTLHALWRAWHAGQYFARYLLPLRQRLHALGTELIGREVVGVPAIFSSLLHMSFNRAGIPPIAEATIRWWAASLEGFAPRRQEPGQP